LRLKGPVLLEGSNRLEIVIVAGIRRLELLGISDGVVLDGAGNGRGGLVEVPPVARSGMRTIQGQLSWAEFGESGGVHTA